MVYQDYNRDILAINSANLAANIENVSINEEILRRNAEANRQIIELLGKILKEVKQRDYQ